jgi:hypothetical protein
VLDTSILEIRSVGFHKVLLFLLGQLVGFAAKATAAACSRLIGTTHSKCVDDRSTGKKRSSDVSETNCGPHMFTIVRDLALFAVLDAMLPSYAIPSIRLPVPSVDSRRI